MKPFNKRVNKRKASKVTLKNHRKGKHPSLHDEMNAVSEGIPSIRPEDIKLHQY